MVGTQVPTEIERLLDGLTARDEHAVRHFLHVYGPHVRGVLHKRFNMHNDDFEDLCQTVMLHLYENDWQVLRRWNGASSFKTYLATVSINKGIDYVRNRRNTPLDCDDDPDMPGDDDALGLASDKEIQNLVNKVMHLFSRDYPDCHKRLKLKYFHDFSYKEIAEILEESVNQVGVYLKRCLERARVLLGYDNPLV